MLEFGFIYFDELEQFLLFKMDNWLHKTIQLRNYKDCTGKMKTLVCHDMKGGYLEHDR